MKKTVYILSASLLVGIVLSFLFSNQQSEITLGATYKFNPFTNNLDRVDSSASSTSSTLTSTQVAFGASDDTVTSSPNFTYNTGSGFLTVAGSVTTTNYFGANGYITNIFSNAGTFTTANITTNNSTNVNATNLSGTNVTTTNLSLSGFTAGSVIFATSTGLLAQDNSGLYFDSTNNRLGIGTATPAKALQVAGAVNAITSVARGTNVEFLGKDAANLAAFPRAFFYGYSGSSITNFGLYAASGNATGTTQTPAFFGVSTNASDTQADSVQFINYADTTKAYIAAFKAGSGVRPVPIYLGHATQPDITIATNTYIGFGNVTNPTARLSLAAATFPAGGIAFGTDTYLYRVAADKLKTDDTFIATAIGVGTDGPSDPIHVSVSQNSNTSIRVSNGTSGSAAQADFRAYNSGGEFFSLGIYSAGTSAYGALTARSGFNYSSGTGGLVLMADNAAGTIRFATGGNTERAIIDSTGRLGIGTTNPTAILSLNTSTAATGGIAFGSDTNLYRSAANTLRTDDLLSVGGGLRYTDSSTYDFNLSSASFYLATPDLTLSSTADAIVSAGNDMSITASNDLSITASNDLSVTALNSLGFTGVGGISFLSNTTTNFTSIGDITFTTLGSFNVNGPSNLEDLTFTNATGTLLSLTQRTFDGTPNTDHTAVGNVVDTFNLGATTTIMDVLFLTSAGVWDSANASTSTSSTGMLAIDLQGGTTGNPTKVALPNTFVRDDSWNWTPGQTLYLSTTSSTLTTSTPSGSNQVVRIVGHAVTADVIYWNPSNNYLILE
jgi:hypothetical protein